jgi:hypothetical protein
VCRGGLLLVAVSLLACDLDIKQASQDALDSATKDYQAENSNTPAIPLKTATSPPNIYIDTSLSMKGYVVKNGPQDQTQFDALLDTLGDVLPRARVYLYGDIKGDTARKRLTELANFGSLIHDETSYNREFNPDDVLIRRMLADNPPHLNILVTDGVHSEAGGQKNPPVVSAIAEWLQRGGTFGVLVFRSRFSRQIYSELARKMMRLPSPVNRPFYLFVFSPSNTDYDEFSTRLKQFVKPLDEFVFNNDSVDLGGLPGIEGDGDSYYDDLHPPEKPFWFRSESKEVTDPARNVAVTIRFDVKTRNTYPAHDLHLRVAVTQFERKDGGFLAAAAVDTCTIGPCDESTASPGPPKNSPGNCFKLTFQNDLRAPYCLYKLKFYPEPDVLGKGIRDLSTKDDSRLDQAERTYLFYELMSALVDAHLKDTIARKRFVPWYIFVENASQTSTR